MAGHQRIDLRLFHAFRFFSYAAASNAIVFSFYWGW